VAEFAEAERAGDTAQNPGKPQPLGYQAGEGLVEITPDNKAPPPINLLFGAFQLAFLRL
jgi:hypothetical protein